MNAGLDGDGDRDPLRRRHHGQRDHEMERDRAFVDALDHHHQNQNNQQQLDMDRIDDVPFEELVGIQVRQTMLHSFVFTFRGLTLPFACTRG